MCHIMTFKKLRKVRERNHYHLRSTILPHFLVLCPFSKYNIYVEYTLIPDQLVDDTVISPVSTVNQRGWSTLISFGPKQLLESI